MAVGGPSITSTGIVRETKHYLTVVSQVFIYLGTLALDTSHISLLPWKIALLSTQRLRKLAQRPFIGGGKLNHQGIERRERYDLIVDDFYLCGNNVG